MFRERHRKKRISGFTLPEVMVAMFLISMMCLSVFVGLQQITKTALSVAIRDEAYHLLQAKAEELLQGDYGSFVASTSDESITSCVKTTYSPNTASALALQSDNASGRVTFARRVVSVASTDTSKTLRIEVQWTWQGHPYLISVPLFRAQ